MSTAIRRGLVYHPGDYVIRNTFIPISRTNCPNWGDFDSASGWQVSRQDQRARFDFINPEEVFFLSLTGGAETNEHRVRTLDKVHCRPLDFSAFLAIWCCRQNLPPDRWRRCDALNRPRVYHFDGTIFSRRDCITGRLEEMTVALTVQGDYWHWFPSLFHEKEAVTAVTAILPE